MKFLLDTHVLLSVLHRDVGRFGRLVEKAVGRRDAELHASVASLWEITLKWRLGKLDLRQEPDELPATIADLGLSLLPITERHVLTSFAPEPATRDPFDRLLLSICRAESFRLLTADRALVEHPLAYRG